MYKIGNDEDMHERILDDPEKNLERIQQKRILDRYYGHQDGVALRKIFEPRKVSQRHRGNKTEDK
jgi:hypothetical protein